MKVVRSIGGDVVVCEDVLHGHHDWHHLPTEPQKQQYFRNSPQCLRNKPISMSEVVSGNYLSWGVERIAD